MYSIGHDPNNSDDSPDYGNFLFGGWSCTDWRTWYFSLLNKYGADVARQKWLAEWESWSNYFSTDYSWCKYETDFEQFLTDNNITGQTNIISNTVVAATKVTHSILDTIESTVKVAGVAIPVVIAAAAVLLLLMAVSHTKAVIPEIIPDVKG